MTVQSPTEGSTPLPAHIPAELVRTFDFHSGLGDRPQEAIAGLLEGPRIFFSPVRHTFGGGPGAWVVSRAEDVRFVLGHPAKFSSVVQGEFMHAIGEKTGIPPLDSDPPMHGHYRSVVSALFSARRMVALEDNIRARCLELLARFKNRGHCEFVAEFAEEFPTGIFIDLMGLPGERLADFVGWNQQFIHGETPAERVEGTKTILAFFRDVYRDPSGFGEGTIIHELVNAEIEGKELDEDQFAGVAFLVFSAGLDTVVSSLGFIFRLLAERPDLQEVLRANIADIPRYAEEMMRLFSPVTPQRVALEDIEIGGVAIKKGDLLALSLTAASRDPDLFSDPAILEPARNPNPHFAFGAGIHRCLGAQLARRDIAVAIELWLTELPPFRIAPDAQIQAAGGSVLSLNNLPLVW